MTLTLAAVACGALFGALLPLPIYVLSVPYGSPLHTSCPHCGRSLRWAGPVCPQCTRRLGPPWWLASLLAALTSWVLAFSLGRSWVLPLFLALGVLGVGLSFVDLAVKRLPASVVRPSVGVSVVLFAVLAAATREWGAFGRALLGALALGLVFALLHLLPGGNLGFGDVQLAALLGLFLGWLGWAFVIWGALLPWLVNAPILVVLLISGRVDRRTKVPFGPAMMVGALLSVAVGSALRSWWV